MVLVESPHSQQSVCPHKHHSNQSQAVKAELCCGEFDVVLKLRFQFVILVQDLADEFAIDGAEQAKDTEGEEVELGFIDADTVLEVVDDEHENGCEEIDRVHDGERQVELGRCYDQPVNDHYDVSLEYVPKIDLVFVVQTQVVVSHHCEIENHRYYAPDQRGLYGVHFMVVGVDECEGK